MAAVKTVDNPGFLLHSVHCYFVDPTQPKPVIYEVDRSKDGRSFCTRAVKAFQDEKVVFHCLASFHNAESVNSTPQRLNYSSHVMPDVPLPDDGVDSKSDFIINKFEPPLISGLALEMCYCLPRDWVEEKEAGKPVQPR